MARFYWIAYVSGGKRRFEGTKSERKQDAQTLLTSRLGDVGRGIAVTPKMGRKTLDDGLKAVVNDLTMNGRRSIVRWMPEDVLVDPTLRVEPPTRRPRATSTPTSG